jgi:hypothetical protein
MVVLAGGDGGGGSPEPPLAAAAARQRFVGLCAALCEDFRLLLFGVLQEFCEVAALRSCCLRALSAASLSAFASRSFFLASAVRCRSAFALSAKRILV